MSEADLAKPVMDWLRSRGLTPYGEVRWYSRSIDIVGLSDDRVEAVELKRNLSKHLIYQAHLNQLAAHASWCAVASRPRNGGARLPLGLGLLLVSSVGVEILVEPGESRRIAAPHHIESIRRQCARMTPEGPAGLPTMRGIGPAQDVYRAVEKYLADNPQANWRQIFEAIPNHYKHARSMQSAMGTVKAIREARARRAALSQAAP